VFESRVGDLEKMFFMRSLNALTCAGGGWELSAGILKKRKR
jgi:muramoyltetrapeptide carboxypeptidase LdcA involved in peptidoglycan recycling